MNQKRNYRLITAVAMIVGCVAHQNADGSRLTMAGSIPLGGRAQTYVRRGNDYIGAELPVNGDVTSVVDLLTRPNGRLFARERVIDLTSPGGVLVADDLVVLDGIQPRFFRMEVEFSTINYQIRNDNFALVDQQGDDIVWQSTFFERMSASAAEVMATWKLTDEFGSAEGTFPVALPDFYYGQWDHRDHRLGIRDLPDAADYLGADWAGHFEVESATPATINGFDYGYPRFMFHGSYFMGTLQAAVPEPSSVTIASVSLLVITFLLRNRSSGPKV